MLVENFAILTGKYKPWFTIPGSSDHTYIYIGKYLWEKPVTTVSHEPLNQILGSLLKYNKFFMN